MMSEFPGGQPHDDERLVDYLLGRLSDEEAEQFDELSIADDEFALRLRAVENDLVDAYVRGELTGPRLQRFESSYLASPGRRHKIEFAHALRMLEDRRADVPTPAPAAAEVSLPGRRGGMWRPFRQWALAAAALVGLVAAGYLIVQNQRLQEEVSRARSVTASLEESASELRAELEQERSASAAIRGELARLRESLPSIPAVRLPSIDPLVLLPMRRGVEEISSLTIPGGVERVPIRLTLTSDDFARYAVVLRSPASGETVWQSGPIPARGGGSDQYVEVEVPAAALDPGTWTLELAGHAGDGREEFVASYTFRVAGRR